MKPFIRNVAIASLISIAGPAVHAADADVETVVIHNERITRACPIDAKQGGQFIEVLCNLIPSMLAQQVTYFFTVPVFGSICSPSCSSALV